MIHHEEQEVLLVLFYEPTHHEEQDFLVLFFSSVFCRSIAFAIVIFRHVYFIFLYHAKINSVKFGPYKLIY